MSKLIRNIATQHPIWTSQPSNVSQVRHPAFSKGGSYIYAPWIAPNTVLTPSGSALNMTVRGSPKVVTSPVGYAGKFVASNSDCITNQDFLSPFTFPRITIAIASAGATTGSIRSIIGVANYGGRYTGIRASAAANTFEYQYYGSATNALLIGTTTFADDTVCVIVGVSYSTFDHELYVNGKLEATSTTDGGGDPGCDSVMVGCANDLRIWDLRANGLIVFGAVGQGSLSRPSVKQLAQNPYQIFTPLARQVPFDLVRGPTEPRQSYMMGTTSPEVSTAMPAAILKTGWTSQPQGAVPALRNGVKASSIFVPNASLYGALHSAHFIRAGAGGRELVMPYFPTQRMSAGHGNVSFSAEWTIVCVYRRNAEDLGWSRAFSAGGESATSAVFGLAYGSAGGSFGQLYIVVSGSNASSVGNYSPTDTDPVGVVSVQVFTCKGGVVTSWKNGWLKLAGTTANIGSVNAGQMYLGSQVAGQSGGFNILGLITLPYGLSDRDGRDLSANPWQIFAPQSKQIWVTT